MTANNDLPRRLAHYYDTEPPLRAPDWVLRGALSTIETTPQRRGLLVPRRYPDLSTYTKLAAAAVVVIAVGGFAIWQLGPGGPDATPGPGAGQATPLPATPTPTATPTPAATPARVPGGGGMRPGTYFAHPLPAPADGLTLTFTVPAGWFGFGDGTIFPTDESVPGISLQFVDVTSVNSDMCQWKGPDGDVSAGTTVDDLVAALVAQTAYEVSDPVDVSIAGYSGKRVDVVYPAELFEGTGSSAPDCDEGVVRLWSTSAHGETGIYGQGPDERWQANILDVDGTRLVIVAQDDPGTTAADRAAVDAIVDSMVIEP